MSGQYGVADLLGACIDAHVWNPENKTGEYDLIRCSVLAKAFGLRITEIRPHELPVVQCRARDATPEDDYLAGLLEACLRARGTTVSPFREYLEGPDNVIAFYQRFGARLNELASHGAQASFDYALHEMTVAVAAGLWHLSEDATVSVDLSAVLPTRIVYDIDPDYDD